MLSYYLVYPILYAISLLPMPLLYCFSTVLKFIIFDILGYRKKVILSNLKNSFPQKSDEEINQIANDFYKYFCDLVFEIVKSLSISNRELNKRFIVPEAAQQLMNFYFDQNISVIIAMGHHGNWEWGGNAFGIQIKHQLYGIFRPLHNKGFGKIIEKVRSKFNTKLISDKGVIPVIQSLHKNNSKASAIVFLTDQSPSGKNKYWTTFLNQETAVFWGIERFSKKYNLPVIYANIVRYKRGYYKVELKTLVNQPKDFTVEGDISELHTKAIEADIISQPETWLWTHKRWKRRRSEDNP